MERQDRLEDKTHPWPEDQREMDCCPNGCEGHFMQPSRWTQAETRGSWRVWLFCGECLTHYEGVFDEWQVGDFDEALDAGTVELSDTASRLSRECMEGELATMITAFEADLISADDFA